MRDPCMRPGPHSLLLLPTPEYPRATRRRGTHADDARVRPRFHEQCSTIPGALQSGCAYAGQLRAAALTTRMWGGTIDNSILNPRNPRPANSRRPKAQRDLMSSIMLPYAHWLTKALYTRPDSPARRIGVASLPMRR